MDAIVVGTAMGSGGRRAGVGRRRVGVGLVAAGLLVLGSSPGWAQEPPGVLVVDKVVDADGDGVFADLEEAPASGAATFRVTLASTATHPLQVTSVVDVVGEATLDVLTIPGCEALATTLEPQAPVACTFTIDRYLHTYARQPRRELTNRVEVVATHDTATFTGADDATVRNPNADVVALELLVGTDADGDGTFTDDEEAADAGGEVPVRVEVHNASPGSVALVALAGTRGDGTATDLFAACPALDGMRLWGVGEGHGDGEHEEDEHDGHDPGERPTWAVCTFVDQAPAAGEELTLAATATVAKRHDTDVSATATATARVRTAAAPVPHVALELRVGPAGGALGDHDGPPGARVALPDGRGAVDLQVEVVNTGPVAVLGVVDVPGVDLAPCALPWTVQVGEIVSCDLERVPARAGAQVLRATVTARDGDQVVVARDEAHYVGVAVSDESVERPSPAPAPSPPPEHPAPLAPAPTVAPGTSAPVAALEALPRTGLPMVAGTTGAAMVLLGLAMLGWPVPGRRRRRVDGRWTRARR